MITIPKNKVAVVPIFDSTETKGGIIKATVYNYKRDKNIYEIYDVDNNKILDEAEDREELKKLLNKWYKRGVSATYKTKKTKIEDQPLDSGERCDQGIVKYIGSEVEDISIGDYVFFSGYTGTLLYIEGEGKLIIIPEEFVICKFDLDKFVYMPGIYFRSREGEYFSATYEQIMNVIADNITDLGLALEIKSEIPKHEDYYIK